MAVVTILKRLQDFASKLFKTFYFKLICDNAFLTTNLSTGKTSQNFVVYIVNTHTQKSLQTLFKMNQSCSFLLPGYFKIETNNKQRRTKVEINVPPCFSAL